MFSSLWSSSPTFFVINVKLVAMHSNSYINSLCFAMSYALALFHTLNMLSIDSETAKGMDFCSLKFDGLWALSFSVCPSAFLWISAMLSISLLYSLYRILKTHFLSLQDSKIFLITGFFSTVNSSMSCSNISDCPFIFIHLFISSLF